MSCEGAAECGESTELQKSCNVETMSYLGVAESDELTQLHKFCNVDVISYEGVAKSGESTKLQKSCNVIDADALMYWLEIEVKSKLSDMDGKLNSVLSHLSQSVYTSDVGLSVSMDEKCLSHALSLRRLHEQKVAEEVQPGSSSSEVAVKDRARVVVMSSEGAAAEQNSDHKDMESSQQDICDKSAARQKSFLNESVSGFFDAARRTLKHAVTIRTRPGANEMKSGVLRRHRCEKFWHCLEDAESGTLANIYASIMPGLTMLSAVFTLAQTPEPPWIHGWGAAIGETSIEIIFITEFLVRFVACPNHCSFLTNIFNVIDLVAGCVLGVRIFLAGLNLDDCHQDVKIFLFVFVPTLRMMKSLRRFQQLHLIQVALERAAEALPVLMVTLSFLVLVFSSVIYLVEPRDNIDTLPKAMWLTIVTMTTVGYGDVSPVSGPGYLVTSVLILISVLYMAMPIGIVGQTFGSIWHERHRILLLQQTRQRLVQWGYTAEDIPVIFHVFDEDLGGEIELPEFKKLIVEMGIGLKEDRIVELFESLDMDAKGGIDARQFVQCVFPSAFHRLYKLDADVRGRRKSDCYVQIDGSEALSEKRYAFPFSATARFSFTTRARSSAVSSHFAESEASHHIPSMQTTHTEENNDFYRLGTESTLLDRVRNFRKQKRTLPKSKSLLSTASQFSTSRERALIHMSPLQQHSKDRSGSKNRSGQSSTNLSSSMQRVVPHIPSGPEMIAEEQDMGENCSQVLPGTCSKPNTNTIVW